MERNETKVRYYKVATPTICIEKQNPVLMRYFEKLQKKQVLMGSIFWSGARNNCSMINIWNRFRFFTFCLRGVANTLVDFVVLNILVFRVGLNKVTCKHDFSKRGYLH